MLDPVVDPVLDPVVDPPLDPLTDPAVRAAADPGDADPAVVAAVIEVRNRFGVSGLRAMIHLAQVEIVAAEQAIAELRPDPVGERPR